MSGKWCHIACGMCSSRTITKCPGKIGYGLTWILYILPLRPSNLRWNCSAGLLSAQRKHLRAAMACGVVSAVLDSMRRGLHWTVHSNPSTSSCLVLADLRARKLAAARGQTESWSLMNLSSSCITEGLEGNPLSCGIRIRSLGSGWTCRLRPLSLPATSTCRPSPHLRPASG